MNRYWILVKFKDEPGAGFGRAYINADNPIQALEMFKALYGRLLVNESVMRD